MTYLGVTTIFSDHTVHETNTRRQIPTTLKTKRDAATLCISSVYMLFDRHAGRNLPLR